MKDPSPTRRLEPPTLEQFRAFVKKIVSVPKSEVDKEEKIYQHRRVIEKQKLTTRSKLSKLKEHQA